ncbi:hypothetical protein [Amycolatopsis sp. DSM 110486]|uniref:hypothetical protein n=1 Tax=Amycolatopsis sp. DSM 110486 TaxID=2865832 RepID=UPI001C69AD4A|nr:hypothetical protein [Amycolatopsis sp. DSM 110486]QYN17584.1 hypothetical protein K1T34_32890 [Amycolatopsis sp. DSM 110486]
MSTTITAGAIDKARATNPAAGYIAYAAKYEAGFPIVAITEVGPIVSGFQADTIGRLVRTGQSVDIVGDVDCRIEFARKLGDAAGTLVFGHASVSATARARFFS